MKYIEKIAKKMKLTYPDVKYTIELIYDDELRGKDKLRLPYSSSMHTSLPIFTEPDISEYSIYADTSKNLYIEFINRLIIPK